MAKIKKDDLVQVISGKDKGKQGKVLRGSTEGGLQVVEAPIHISNVAVVDPETKKPTRVGYRFETVEKDGVSKTVKVRFAKASGKEL